jgi:hypothetical protein
MSSVGSRHEINQTEMLLILSRSLHACMLACVYARAEWAIRGGGRSAEVLYEWEREVVACRLLVASVVD